MSYYAVNVGSVLFNEGFIAQTIKNKLQEMPFGKPSISIKELYESCSKCAELLANENLNINFLTLKGLVEKLRYFHKVSIIILNRDETEFEMVTNERNHRMISI